MRPAHPLPILRPRDSGGRRLPGPPGRALRPERPPARVPGAQPAAGRSLPSRSWVSATGDYLPGSGPARRGRKPPELRVPQRLGASEGESDTARAPLPPELKARGRSRPGGGQGRRLSGPVPPVQRRVWAENLSEPGSEHSGNARGKLLGFQENPVILEQTP